MAKKTTLHHRNRKQEHKLIILDESGKLLEESTISKEMYEFAKKESERFGSIEEYIISLIKEDQNS